MHEEHDAGKFLVGVVGARVAALFVVDVTR